MRRLIEDVGPAWCAGRLGTLGRLLGERRGAAIIGSRVVAWSRGAVTVSVGHEDAGGAPVSYEVALVTGGTPNGGTRVWWSCPECGRRAGMLYLPADRDRLGCRRCCGLGYASQYPRARERRGTRTSAPAFSVTTESAVWERGAGLRVKRWVRIFGPVVEEATEGDEDKFDCEYLPRTRLQRYV